MKLNDIYFFDIHAYHEFSFSGMPVGDYIYANDLVAVLIKKHEANAYKNMVRIYMHDSTYMIKVGWLTPELIELPNWLPFLYMILIYLVDQVFYLEACESGSMFEGLLPANISIYATTASNSTESSWGTYCPGMNPPPPPEYDTCLGDLYSIAWMEDW